MRNGRLPGRRAAIYLLSILAVGGALSAQTMNLNENCTVSVLNRSIQVEPDGSWVLPNVPTNVGFVRARATCVENGVTRSGQSDYFLIPPNGLVEVAEIRFDTPAPIPATLTLSASTTQLATIGATVQVTATATYANGTSGNLSQAVQGTNWFTSNPRIATVSADGLVTAVATGNALISAMNEGALGMLRISILTGGDADGDGLPDDFELTNGLDPANPADAAGDLDNDGLSNLQEFQRGTLLNVADTDGDGLRDGDEVPAGTNPLLADTDGDGISDGLEVQTGSNPLDPASFNLAQALQSITVAPSAFEIVVNTLVGEASRMVAVTGNLKDGNTINLTARSRGTSYVSSNLAIASFGVVDGQIFGGTAGTATITITNGGHTAQAVVTVRTFAPQALGFLQMPGFANNVDVAGNYAYVAAGSAGLVIVDVTNRRAPAIVKTVDTPGNANDVRVAGAFAYVADGSAGLQIVDVSVPASARIIGALDTADAWDVVVAGGTAYVADGASGLKIVDVRNAVAPQLVGSVDTNGVAKGVDVAGNFAVVADGTATVVIDIRTPAVPTLTGAVATSDVRDVVVEGTYAYVADSSTSVRVIDFSTPASPWIAATADRNLAGIPTDVAKVRELVFAADVFFVNGVSITDVRSPGNPTVRARLDFPQRDDNGTGIAVDHQFVYLTAERGFTQNGSSGDTALYIGQYLFAEDTAGIAPAVQLTSPLQQPIAVEGGTLRIAANATDDILVASVDFIVNGEVIATDTVEPYETMFSVPVGAASLNISARAIDLAGNTATTPQVIMSVIPDPGTTVAGRVVLDNGSGVAGATVVCSGRSGTSLSDGSFSVSGVPTVTGSVRCTASYNAPNGIPFNGVSASLNAIPGGTTNAGNIVVRSALTVTQFPKSGWNVTSSFLARTLELEGNHLVVGPWTSSNQLVFLDVSDPAAPVHRSTRQAGNGEVYDFELKDGWVYVASYDFCTINATSGNRTCIDYGGGELAVAVKPPYVFASVHTGDGRIRLFDVTNPAAPRRVREQGVVPGVGFVQFYDLLVYGSRYLVGISPNAPNGVGRDVVVVDISDINNWRKIAELDVPSFTAFRGEIRGNTLYLASDGGPDAVMVDLTNPAAPTVLGRRAASSLSPGVWPLYNELFVAAGTDGLVSLDVTVPASPVVTRTLNTGGSAWDVLIRGNYAYVANEAGLAVVGLTVPPSIDTARITLERNGTLVNVRGAAGAITGQTPLTFGLDNTATAASVSGIAVAADGSFSGSILAAAGEPLTITAIDVAGRVAGPLSIGTAPFGTASFIPLRLEESWRARTLAAEGSMLVVHGFGEDYHANGNAVVFDISNPFTPVQRYVKQIGNGQAYDTEIVNGVAVTGSWDFCVTDLTNATSGRTCHDPGHGEIGVAVSGRYAFSAGANEVGGLRVYDITNISAPRFIRSYNFLPYRANFLDLIAFGSSYLVAISPDDSGGAGHDAVVIDWRDINGPVVVANVDVPNFHAFRGKIRGNMLYLASGWDGGGFAIVDLTNPRAPQVRSVVNDAAHGWRVTGLDVSGNTLAAAHGNGVSFYDVSNPSAPVKLGTQSTAGHAWDVLFAGGAAYVAAESGLAVLGGVTAPPVVDPERISIAIATPSTATVTGLAQAIGGTPPVTATVHNVNSGVSVANVAVAADGSFTAIIAARAGERLAIVATDGAGRNSGTVHIGTVPFGSSTTLLPLRLEDSWRARDLTSEGTMLVVSGWGEDYGSNGNAIVFDISNPAAPVQRFVKQVANGQSYDMEIVNGWAYNAGWDFCVTNLNDPGSTRVCLDPGHGELGVAVSGRYAFTAGANEVGGIRVFDISNPAAPRHLRSYNFLPYRANFTDIIAYGPDYLIALSPDDSGGTGHDVVVIDRRDVNGLVAVVNLDIPNFRAFRGRMHGPMLYIASAHDVRDMAIVDMTNPRAPVLKSIVSTGGFTRGVAVTGTTAATADLAIGVSLIDVANPSAPVIQGTQFVGGNAWDALFASGTLYVANEQGLVIFRDVVSPPIIDLSLISLAPTTPTTAAVAGAARAITGQAPLTVTVRNATTGLSAAPATVAADGSFSVAIDARPGEVLTVLATDAAGRAAGPLTVGTVPFGAPPLIVDIPPSVAGDTFRARTLTREGNMLVVTGWGEDQGTNGNAVIYDISDPVAPVRRFVKQVANGQSYDMEIVNGWAYDAGWDFCVTNLNDPNSSRVCHDPGHGELGVSVSGQYAFTTGANEVGGIRLYDISNPAAPRFLRSFNLLPYRANFTDVITYGSDYLIALSPDDSGGTGHDVVVIDRRDVNALVAVANLDIPNFRSLRGRLEGTMLYIASAHETTAMAVVDMSNPRQPQLRSMIDSGGRTRGVFPAGGKVATAEGSLGVGFVDATNPAAPVLKGRQLVGGNTWDVLATAGVLYVANEQGFVIIPAVDMPATIDPAAISVAAESSTTARVTGSARAISGRLPLTVQVKNLTTGATSAATSVPADGTFTASVTAVSGETLAVTATDANGAVSGPITAGTVPFASSMLRLRPDFAALGDNFRARSLTMEGNLLLVWGWGEDYHANGNAAIYDVSDPASPSLLRTRQIANGQAYDVEIVNGWAYVASWDFCTFNLADPNASRWCFDPGHGELGVAVSGQYAFSTGANEVGGIRVFNVSSPAAPQYLGNHNLLPYRANFVDVIAYGNYLYAISPDDSGGAGHDLVVVDKTNVNALFAVKNIDIPNFRGFRGRIYGTKLFIASMAETRPMAIVDISNPASPVVEAVVEGRSFIRGVTRSGSRAIAADFASGVAFYDISTPTAPVLLGHHVVGGQSWDALVNGNNLYVATEQNLVVLRNLDAPWSTAFFRAAPGALLASTMEKMGGLTHGMRRR